MSFFVILLGNTIRFTGWFTNDALTSIFLPLVNYFSENFDVSESKFEREVLSNLIIST